MAIKRSKTETHSGLIPWLPIVRMAIVALIAFGYASTMPRGPSHDEYLRVFGYDPSWYGISLIFMISGYLTMRSLMRHGSGVKMLASRFARNYPVLIVFALSVVFILFPIFGADATDNSARTGQLFDYFLKVVSCFDPNALMPGLLDNALYTCIIQGGLWTFRWGVIAFIGAAIAWHLGLLKDRRMTLALAAICIASYAWLVSYVGLNPDAKSEYLVTAMRIAWPFLVGMSAYAYRNDLPRNLLVPVILLVVASANYVLLPWTPYIEILFEMALGYGVFLAITQTRPIPVFLKSVPDLSLGLYVFNWPVAQITLLLMPGIAPLSLFTISFPITILIALGLWWVINRPLNAKIAVYTGLAQRA